MARWLITGCSTGLGRALSEVLLVRGECVALTARNRASIEELAARFPATAIGLRLDVTCQADVDAVVAHGIERFGAIDVLVNNAGYGYRSAVEEGEEQAVQQLFATNLFGAVALIKAVLPGMRARRSGVIANISSGAGRMSAPGSGYYSATKYGLEGLSDALRQEVAPLGIQVVIIEPGRFRTDFAGRSLVEPDTHFLDYADTVGPRRKGVGTSDGDQPGDPAKAAQVIADVLLGNELPSRLVLGRDLLSQLRENLGIQIEELDRWAHVSVVTDFDE